MTSKRQRLVSQGSLSRMFQQAAEFWKRQEYQQTIEILERAARLDPANAGIQLDLGRAYGLRYQYPEAERCFEKAARVAARRVEALTEAGRRCLEFGYYEMAKRYLERAAEEKGATADTLLPLAELHERHAQLTEATHYVERALRLDAGNPAVQLARARLDRMSGRLVEAESRVQTWLKGGTGDAWVRAQGWYELGEILDRQARYDEAMEGFLEAKALLRPAASNHAATLRQIQERVRQMEESITATVLERWAGAAEALGPARRLAILCGHPRSGTTLLEQVLDSHPGVISAEETHILHDEAYLPLCRGFQEGTSVLEVLDSAPLSQLRQAHEDYFRLNELFLGEPLGNRILVDKNPALNVLLPAVARIFPEAKLLVALRDPRDVCLSCFMQPLAPNPVSSAYLSLEGTVTQYLSVMGFWRTSRPRLRNPFLEVRYEELVEHLEEVSSRALGFLGLAWDDRVLHFAEHARSKALRSPTYAEVSRPLTRRAIGRWQHYRRHLEPYLPRLEPMIRDLGYAD